MVAPAVLISRCLLGEHCRYDGRLKPSILEHLAQYQVTAQHVRWGPFVPRSTAVFLFRANLVRFARAVLQAMFYRAAQRFAPATETTLLIHMCAERSLR